MLLRLVSAQVLNSRIVSVLLLCGVLPWLKGLNFSNFDLTLSYLTGPRSWSWRQPAHSYSMQSFSMQCLLGHHPEELQMTAVIELKMFPFRRLHQEHSTQAVCIPCHIYSVRFHTSAALKCSHFTAEVISNSSFQRGNVNWTMSPFLPLIKAFCQVLEETLTCSSLLNLTTRLCNLDIQPSAEYIFPLGPSSLIQTVHSDSILHASKLPNFL